MRCDHFFARFCKIFSIVLNPSPKSSNFWALIRQNLRFCPELLNGRLPAIFVQTTPKDTQPGTLGGVSPISSACYDGFCGISMGLSQDWLRHHYFQYLPIYFCSQKLPFSGTCPVFWTDKPKYAISLRSSSSCPQGLAHSATPGLSAAF